MYHLDRSVVDERTFGILAALQHCVSVRVHFACDYAFASLPVVICMCIVACTYCVRKPAGVVNTPNSEQCRQGSVITNDDCRWSMVIAAFWDALATQGGAKRLSARRPAQHSPSAIGGKPPTALAILLHPNSLPH